VTPETNRSRADPRVAPANAAIGRPLAVLLGCYAAASLVHFAHNAQFLGDYPNLPPSWSGAEVWFAWLGMTAVGAGGCLLLLRGHARCGLVLLALYAAFGLDSLGHYLVAPFFAHTWMMNLTILLEVTAAAALLLCVLPLLWRALATHGRSG
jgi:hypothetical protein